MASCMAWFRFLIAALALTAISTPAAAQFSFSDGYQFLEAVRKEDGAKATELLNQPGSTVVNARDVSSGESALHIVMTKRNPTWARFLLQNGANPNIRDNKGVTPMVVAANIGFIEGVETLIKNGARLDDANDAGETPLISAVHRRDIPMMRVLLKAGANPDRADNSGRSARDYAALQGAGSPALAEIQANAKPAGEFDSGEVYGPSF